MTCSSGALEKFSEIARDEIGETGVLLADALEKVKNIITENYGNLRLPLDADNLLERCLRCRKLDVTRAALQVHSFFKLLQEFYDLHKDMYFLPSVVQSYHFDSLGLSLLKNRDSKGRAVILGNFERMPKDTFNIDKLVAAFIILLNESTRLSVETQRVGLVVVCNLRGYEFAHARQFTLARIRALTRLIQGSFPVRYKGFYCVRAPSLFTYTYSMMKPCLGTKMKSRIHIHGYDFTALYEQVSPDILPDFLGGKLSYEESVDADFMRQLLTRDEYYRELFRCGYMTGSDNET